MEDEFAWEESGLGHGLFTYCFSVRSPSLGSFVAEAVQPDNRFGPSLAIAQGEGGCSLLTAGAQNPVIYWNGTGELEVCGRSIALFVAGKCMSLMEMRNRLRAIRDDEVARRKSVSGGFVFNGRLSDEEMRAGLRETKAYIESHSEPSVE